MMIRWFFRPVIRRRRKAPVNPQIEAMRVQAKATLPPRLAQLALEHGFHYNKVFIKNNLSNWGSCSSLGNINLNLRLVALPADLQDYVMLHELCHLKYLNHSPQFHALLESVCPGHGELARRMKEYKM